MPASVLLSASILLQCVAAVLALRLIRITGRHWAWLLIAGGMSLMIVRRVVSLIELCMGDSPTAWGGLAEWVALGTSILMAVGVASIAPLFQSIRRSEEVLRQGESRYRAIVQDQTELICRFLPDGTLTFVNEAYCRTFNKKPEDLLGRSFYPLIPEGDQGFVRRQIASLSAQNPIVIHDHRVLKPGGAIGWQQWTNRALLDDEGRLVEFQAVGLDITRRKDAEAALQQERDFVSAVLDTAGVLVVVLDAQGRIARFNRACEQVTGYTFAEVQGKRVWDFLLIREEVESVRAVFEDLRGGHFPNEHENDWLTKDGRSRWIAWSNTALLDSSGGVEYVIATGIDMTDRREAEARLRASEANYRTIFDSANDAIFVHDIQTGAILDVNRKMCELYGYSAEEARCLNVEALSAGVPPFTQQEALRWIARAASGEPQLFEWLAKDKSGRQFWVEVNLKRIRIEDRDRLLAVVRDISQRKQAEQELQESQRALATLMSNLPGMAYRCRNDPQWTMEFVSQGCKELTGYEPDDLLLNRRLSYAGLILPEDREWIWNEVQNAVQQRRPFQLTYRIVTADSEQKWVWEQGQGIFSADGQLLALEGFITDITQQRRLEDQVRQAQKMEAVGLLAGGIAHDFNNILTAILGNAELLSNHINREAAGTLRARDGMGDAVAQIEWAAQRAASLTRQLLTFSRRRVIQPKVLDLTRVLSDMEGILRRLIGEDIRVDMVLAPDLWPIRADAGQVEQVVLNLVVNARDAMPSGGRIEIGARNVVLDREEAAEPGTQPGPHVMLAVSDTGCGMDRATTDRVFEPFFTTKQLGKGTGLGLATVFGIVRQAGGVIRVYSEPGHGTTFKIYWPRVMQAVAEPDGEVLFADVPGGPETVLIAEDEDLVRRLTHRILETRGYTVLSADCGKEALATAEQHEGRIDLLISDVIMPDMNGVQLAETLIASRPEMKVLYLSGYTSSAIADRGVLRAGVQFLEKPFAGETLARRVRDILDQQEGSR